MNSSKYTNIHTGLYGANAAKNLKLIVAGLADEWNAMNWQQQNSISINSCIRMHAEMHHLMSVGRDETGETVLQIDNEKYAWQSRWHDASLKSSPIPAGRPFNTAVILDWLRFVVEDIVNDKCANKPDNALVKVRSVKSCVTSRVWELKALLLALRGQDVAARYGKAVADKVVGQPSDPIRAEIEIAIDEEVKKIGESFKTVRKNAKLDLAAAIKNLRREYQARLRQIAKDERAAITEKKRELRGLADLAA